MPRIPTASRPASPFETGYNQGEARASSIPLGITQLRNPKPEALQKLSTSVKDFGRNLAKVGSDIEKAKDYTHLKAVAAQEGLKHFVRSQNNLGSESAAQTFVDTNEAYKAAAVAYKLDLESTKKEDLKRVALFRNSFFKPFSPAYFNTVHHSHKLYQENSYNKASADIVTAFAIDGDWESALKDSEDLAHTVYQGDPNGLNDALAEIPNKIADTHIKNLQDNSSVVFDQLRDEHTTFNIRDKDTDFEARVSSISLKVQEEREKTMDQITAVESFLESKGYEMDVRVLRQESNAFYDRQEDLLKKQLQSVEASKERVSADVSEELKNTAIEAAVGYGEMENLEDLKSYNSQLQKFYGTSREAVEKYTANNGSVTGSSIEASTSTTETLNQTQEALEKLGVNNGNTFVDLDPEVFKVSLSEKERERLAGINVLDKHPKLKKILNNPSHPQHSEVLEEFEKSFHIKKSEGGRISVHYSTLRQALVSEGKQKILNQAILNSPLIRPEDKASLKESLGSVLSENVQSQLKDIFKGLEDGTKDPGQAKVLIDKLPVSEAEKVRMKKRVDDNVSIVDVAHEEAWDAIAPVLADNLRTSWNLGGGLTMPLLENIRIRDILSRALKQRFRDHYTSIQHSKRGDTTFPRDFHRELPFLIEQIKKEVSNGYFVTNDTNSQGHPVVIYFDSFGENININTRVDRQRVQDERRRKLSPFAAQLLNVRDEELKKGANLLGDQLDAFEKNGGDKSSAEYQGMISRGAAIQSEMARRRGEEPIIPTTSKASPESPLTPETSKPPSQIPSTIARPEEPVSPGPTKSFENKGVFETFLNRFKR